VFWYAEGHNRTGSFGPLNEATRAKITDEVYRAWTSLAEALDRKTLSHSEGIALLRSNMADGTLQPGFLLKVAGQILGAPMPSQEAWLEHLSQIDTEEKLESWLVNLPEPNPRRLALFLRVMRNAIPSFRKLLLLRAKRLVGSGGGRPEKLPDPETRVRIRGEIKGLRDSRVNLDDIYKRLAVRHKVSARTIKRIWHEGEAEMTKSEDTDSK
jgi:hypothetical protein